MLILMISVLLGGAGNATAEDGAARVTEKRCVWCHGLDSVGIALTCPNLEGQWQRYLRLQLMAYRSGARHNAIMNAQAATLGDEDLRALARYYASQP